MVVSHDAQGPATSEGKLTELQVEAVLSASPGTFGYELIAIITGAGIELSGYVPNKLVKEQALEIAAHTARYAGPG